MRMRSLGGLALLSLQALVAMRPFAALSTAPEPAAMIATHVAHHGAHETAAADPPCHHATEHASGSAAPASQHGKAPAPAHDHESSACHAGTPCCAPTLPVGETTVPPARATMVAAEPLSPHVRRFVADVDRRLPPATAPPALS